MSNVKSWSAVGYGGKSVPTRFQSAKDTTQRLAVLLPGYGYSLAAPLFHFGGQILGSHGFDLLAADYRYNEDGEYLAAAAEQRKERFEADIMGLYQAVASHSEYLQLLFFGKSLGTIAMLRILENRLPWERIALVWLTPATAEGRLLEVLRRRAFPSLIVIGTRDSFYRQSEIEELSGLPHVETMVIEGTDHGLAYPEDPIRSAKLLPDILETISRFAVRQLT